MSDSSTPTIVVVDESPAVGSLFELGTENLDIELKIFSSANSSWTYLRDNKPDLLFIDIKMSGKDGLTFLKELRDLPLHKNTSVVMISSKDYAQDRSIASELGAVEFVTKPMPIRTITDVVLKYIKT